MTKIDWYILKKFMSTFFFTVLIFTMITVIIDFSEKVEKFIESGITQYEIYVQYFPNFIIFIYGLLFPLFTLISVVFFTSRMANNSEILSIFNAGVSFKRLLRPYLIGAVFIAIIHALGSNYFIPLGTTTRLALELKHFDPNKDVGKTNNIHMFLEAGTKVYIKQWRKRDTIIRGFRLERFDSNEMVYLLKATSVSWLGPPNHWQLSNYEIRTFDGMNETLIKGEGKQIDTTLNMTPSDFIDYKDQHNMMTTAELDQYIARQRSRGVGNTAKYEAEYHRRLAEPVTVIILALIGVAVAARKVRGGLGIHLAVGILLGALSLILSRFATVFAAGNALPVILSIWLPNIFFGIIAAVLIAKAQK